jgi:competence protein ComEA
MLRIALSLVAATALVAAATGTPIAAQTKSSSASAKPVTTTVVNINTASATEIATLPGIGPKTAALIVEYRQKNGPFKKIEELMNVKGVGEKSFLKLKPFVTIGPDRSGGADGQK